MTRPTRKPTICDAPSCSVEVQRGKLMCRAHWFATPAPLRRAISDAWKERRIRDWSANCLNARNYHATTADRTAAMRDRQLGERNDA